MLLTGYISSLSKHAATGRLVETDFYHSYFIISSFFQIEKMARTDWNWKANLIKILSDSLPTVSQFHMEWNHKKTPWSTTPIYSLFSRTASIPFCLCATKVQNSSHFMTMTLLISLEGWKCQPMAYPEYFLLSITEE